MEIKEDCPLTAEAEAYVQKLFPCTPPCDSWGVCDNCCEKTLFLAGYNFGFRANEKYKKGVEVMQLALHAAEEREVALYDRIEKLRKR
jgi:hypothetical protein